MAETLQNDEFFFTDWLRLDNRSVISCVKYWKLGIKNQKIVLAKIGKLRKWSKFSEKSLRDELTSSSSFCNEKFDAKHENTGIYQSCNF